MFDRFSVSGGESWAENFKHLCEGKGVTGVRILSVCSEGKEADRQTGKHADSISNYLSCLYPVRSGIRHVLVRLYLVGL